MAGYQKSTLVFSLDEKRLRRSSWHADPSSSCARTFLGTSVRMTIGGCSIHCREVVHRALGVRLDGFSTLSPPQRADLSMFLLQKMQ